MRISPGVNDGACPIKGAIVVLLSLSLATHVPANPTGSAVRAGEIRLQQSGNTLRVIQGTQKGIIDWDTFSIANGETTRFTQPNSQSATLNRVTGASLSRIDGRLLANGRVFLLNSNGIVIGRDGVVDVAGFAASTLDVSNESFLAGGDLNFLGGSQAAVVNLGSISAFDGDIFLVGVMVENSGSLGAPRGTVGLAAGNDVLIRESGSERIYVRGASGGKKESGVINKGTVAANVAELKAHGGNIYGMAVKNEGRVAATGVTREGGQIFLRAGGGRVRSTGSLKAKRSDGSGGEIKVDSGREESRTEIGGTVDASGENGPGGEIVILGNEIEVFEGALILNDGATKGGTTYIGGGLRGQDPEFANAETVTLGNGAVISANAIGSGDGGQVVVFAEGTLVFNGALAARGGLDGGNGGFAELSGKNAVQLGNLTGRIDLSAPKGAAGTLLYDPIDISILAGTSSPIGTSPVIQNTLYSGDIAAFLGTANLIVTTSPGSGGVGNITMDGLANITWNSASNLSFLADNNFAMNSGAVIYAMGNGGFSATATRAISLGSGASITTTNGNLTLSANQQVIATAGTFAGISINGGTLQSTGTGVLSAIGRGGDTGNSNIGISVANGGKIIGGTSAITLLTGSGGLSVGTSNIGVQVTGANSLLSTNGSNLSVFGYGGGTGAASGSNSGVFVTSGGVITSGAGSGVSVEGTGGGGAGLNNKGVWISQSSAVSFGTITSGGGFVSITGTGGGSGASSNNQGVDVAGSNVILSTGGGTLTVTGAAGGNTLTEAIRLSGTVSTTGNQPITLIANSFSSLSGTINSGTGTTTFLPLSNAFAIDLGGADVGGTTLGLTDAELDRITAGTVQIGNGNSGEITVSNAISHGNHLSLTTGAGVTVNNAITMAANKGFTTSAVGAISFATTNADLFASGTGAISLTTARNLSLASGSSVTTVNGNLNLSANQQSTATSGNFNGIDVNGGLVQSTGTGNVTVSGRGGITGTTQKGVHVRGGGDIIGGTSGTVSVTGTGGTGSVNRIDGVTVEGSGATITSGGANVQVTGTGGVSGVAFKNNIGVSALNGGVITAGGTGTVTVLGTGGSATDNGSHGVISEGAGSLITSNNGAVQITGFGGSGGLVNTGVSAFNSGTISAGGATSTLTVTGTGGTGTGGTHAGVYAGFGSAKFTSGGGAVQITGTAGSGGSGNFGIFINDAGVSFTTATNGGNLTLIADSMSFSGAVSANSGSTVTLRQNTNGQLINLGAADSAGVLGLTDAELDRITAGLVQIGNGDTGAITVSSAISHGNHLSLTTGVGVTVNNAITMALNKDFTTSAVGTISFATSNADLFASGTGAISLTTARNLSLASGSSITTAAGDLNLSANAAGTTSGLFEGVYVGNGASVNSGTGAISITGRGGDTINAGNHGIRLDSTSTVGSAGGNIFLTGQARGSAGANPTQEGLIVRGDITTTGSGNITLSGTGGNATSGNIGVHLFDDVLVSTVNGNISITGVSGAGVNSPGIQIADFGNTPTVITSTGGTIALIGDGSAGSSEGILAFGSGTSIGGGTGNIEFTATGNLSLTSNAAIGATGTGAVSLTSTRSISLGGGTSVTTVNGNLTLSANQQIVPDNGDFIGILVDGGTIQSTGTGQVSVRGKGGNKILPFLNVDSQIGVAVRNGGKILGGTTGTLLVEGTGRQIASGRSNYNYGVQVSGSDSLISSNGANVSVIGTGGEGFNDNYGVVVSSDGRITSGGTGNVSVNGTGGNGDAYNNGISLFSGGFITSGGAGIVTVTGTAGSNAWDGSDTYGVMVSSSGSSITSGGGNVSVTGYGGIGGSESYGVFVLNSGLISSGGGSVTVTGEARNVTNSGGHQGGIRVLGSGSTITSGGGNVIVNGLGSTGGEESYGVILNSTGLITSGGAGTVSVTGTAGTASDYSGGVAVYNGAMISSGGIGTVTIDGYGGGGTGGQNHGVDLGSFGSGTSTITSGGGNIVIGGTGGAGPNSSGVRLSAASLITSATNGGDIGVYGTATSGDNIGIERADADIIGDGEIYLQGIGAGTGLAIASSNAANTLGSGLANLILESLGGNVSITNAITANTLQLRDSTTLNLLGFTLTNQANDVNQLSTYGTIGSLDYRDASGFVVGDALNADGIAANGNIKLFGGMGLIDITQAVSSAGGGIDIDAYDIRVSGASVTTTGTGMIDVNADRSIRIEGESMISVVDGDLIMNASVVGGPLYGAYTGIEIDGSTLTTSGRGAISLNGRGGIGDYFDSGIRGVYLTNGAVISSTGTGADAGTITLGGRGGIGYSFNSGVVMQGGTTRITSIDGDISLVGFGGTGGGGNHVGVMVEDDAKILSTGTGQYAAGIKIEGTGGDSGGGGSASEEEGDQNLGEEGPPGGGRNVGVSLSGFSTEVKAVVGSIDIDGFGGAGGSYNYGILMENISDTIESTGVGPLAGSVTIDGTGGTGDDHNAGISFQGDVSLNTTDANVVITGVGGMASGMENHGVELLYGTVITSLGTGLDAGTVTINGTGGSGYSSNKGIVMKGSSTLITSTDGDISLEGFGGTGLEGYHLGVELAEGVKVTSTGTSVNAAGITIEGTGGGSGSYNEGVRLSGTATMVSASGGQIQITGNGGGDSNGEANRGILVSGASVTNLGSGGIGMDGYGGSGNSESDGIQFEAGGRVEVADGDIDLTGSAGGTLGIGVLAKPNSGDFSATGSGSITINGTGRNEAGVHISTPVIGGAGAYFVKINSYDGDVVIGGETKADGEIDIVSPDHVYINGPVSSITGDIDVEGLDVTINAPLTASVGDLYLRVGSEARFSQSQTEVGEISQMGGLSGTAAVNAVLSAGGQLHFIGKSGDSDTVTYAGYSASPIDFDFEVLDSIENLVGTSFLGDKLKGPTLASTYVFNGPNSFEVAGVAVSAFENVLGGEENDVFSFNGGGSLSGRLDGGGGLANEISYAGFTTGAVLNLEVGASSGILGGFSNIQAFNGSSQIDTVIGLQAPSIYQFSTGGLLNVGGFEVGGFDNLFAGPGNDTFLVGPGGGIPGILNGGAGFDVLNYSAYGAPVSVNLSAPNASGFGAISGLESYIGSAFEDSFTGTSGNDTFTINAVNAGNLNNGPIFASFEHLKGGQGADRFLFLNQATVGSVDGGLGTDLLEIDDRTLGGTNTYTITNNQISRNPTYLFSGLEGIKLLLGPGNDTIVTRANGTVQTFDGGAGNDILDMGSGVFLTGSPMVLGNSTIYHTGFEGPLAPNIAPGEVLQLQTGNVPNPQQNIEFEVEDRFTPGADSGMTGQSVLQALSQAGGNAFSAVLAGQAVVLQIDGQQYLFGVPANLDGSVGLPPAEIIERLRESLRADGWAELADAIGFEGPMTLVSLDGAFPVDLDSPIPPELLAILSSGFSLEAAQELFDALEMVVFVPVTAADGAVSLLAVAVPIDESIRAILLEQLNEAAFTELSSTLEL